MFCCFTSQVNSYGHGGTVSSPNHTFSWASYGNGHISYLVNTGNGHKCYLVNTGNGYIYYLVIEVCLFCCFTSQVNSYGHGGTVSLPNHTFSWASYGNGHISYLVNTGNGHKCYLVNTGNGYICYVVNTGNGHIHCLVNTGNGQICYLVNTWMVTNVALLIQVRLKYYHC